MEYNPEILTYDGWKSINDIKIGEVILTLNISSNIPEYCSVTNTSALKYTGTAIRLFGKNINSVVHPNQLFYLKNRYNKFIKYTSSQLYDLNIHKNTHLTIPKISLPTNTQSPEFFILKGVGHKKYKEDVKIPYNIWMSFMGIWLAEGHCGTSRRDGTVSTENNKTIVITQKHPIKTVLIKELLNQFPPEIKWSCIDPQSHPASRFRVWDDRLWEYLSPLGSCYTKYIPIELKHQSSELLECLIKWFHVGDGRDIIYHGYNSKSIFSTSNRMMEDFQEIQLKCGRNGNIITTLPTKDYMYSDHIIKKENVKPLYTLKFNKSNYIHIDNRLITIEPIPFDGVIYSIVVLNNTYYCRNNGKCYWSGTLSL
jgi:hypothetical protein